MKRRWRTLRNSAASRQWPRLLGVLLLLLILHSSAMIFFEDLSIGDAIWLTMTSATTVGYGDLSAQTLGGRVATVLLVYIGGIAILAQVVALFFDHRQAVRDRKLRGDWSWNMHGHIVFINYPKEVGEAYFYTAIAGLRESATEIADAPIIILCEHFAQGISDRLRRLGVVHVRRPVFDSETLEAASVQQAHTVVILSRDHLDPISDSINFELVDRLRDMGLTARIIVEAVRDENRARLRKAGANNVMRPIRSYPEMLMRAIIAPGSERILETLFDSSGEECIRYDVQVQSTWLDIARKLIASDLGLPVAYENTAGEVISVPPSKETVVTRALYVIVNKGHLRESREIEALLKTS